jgi:CBS domain-containing protein
LKPVAELLDRQVIHCVGQGETVLAVAQRMAEWRVGAVTVLDGERLVGIFSERDLMTRVVTKGLSAANTLVQQVMTPNPVVVDAHSSVEQCLRIMQQAKCRHLPVVSAGTLVGIVSIRDLLQWDVKSKDDEIEMMRAFIHYVPPSTPVGSGGQQ